MLNNVLLVIWGLVFLVSCSSDPYLEMPRNCTSEGGIKVACHAASVKSKDLLNQPRKQVESILGKDSKKTLDFHYSRNDFNFYRGGGIIVLYDSIGISKEIQIYPENLDFNEKAIKAFISAENLSVWPYVDTRTPPQLLWDRDPQYYSIGVRALADDQTKVAIIVLSVNSLLTNK